MRSRIVLSLVRGFALHTYNNLACIGARRRQSGTVQRRWRFGLFHDASLLDDHFHFLAFLRQSWTLWDGHVSPSSAFRPSAREWRFVGLELQSLTKRRVDPWALDYYYQLLIMNGSSSSPPHRLERVGSHLMTPAASRPPFFQRAF